MLRLGGGGSQHVAQRSLTCRHHAALLQPRHQLLARQRQAGHSTARRRHLCCVEPHAAAHGPVPSADLNSCGSSHGCDGGDGRSSSSSSSDNDSSTLAGRRPGPSSAAAGVVAAVAAEADRQAATEGAQDEEGEDDGEDEEEEELGEEEEDGNEKEGEGEEGTDEEQQQQQRDEEAEQAAASAAADSIESVVPAVVLSVMRKFNMPLCLQEQLRDHMAGGGRIVRDGVSLTDVCVQVGRLCDTRMPAQAFQGFFSLFCALAWVLECDTLCWDSSTPGAVPLHLVLKQKEAGVQVRMSEVGGLLRVYKTRHATKAPSLARTTTRNVLQDCFWLHLTEPGGDSTLNTVTVKLRSLTMGAERRQQQLKEVPQLLAVMQAAIYKHFSAPASTRERLQLARHAILAAAGVSCPSKVAAAVTPEQRRAFLAVAADTFVQRVVTDPKHKSAGILGRARQTVQHSVVCPTSSLVGKLVNVIQEGLKITLPANAAARGINNLLLAERKLWSKADKPKDDANPLGLERWALDTPALLGAGSVSGEAVAAALQRLLTGKGSMPDAAGGATGGVSGLSRPARPTTGAASSPPSANSSTAAAAAGARASSRSGGSQAEGGAERSQAAPLRSGQPPGSTSSTGAGQAGSGVLPGQLKELRSRMLCWTEGRRRGPDPKLEYLNPLPGLGPVQIFVVTSSASPHYASMLQHMAAVSLIGVDTEASTNAAGASVPALLAFMVPAAAPQGPDPGWLDAVYLIDLVAAGLVSYHQPLQAAVSSGQEPESELLAGIAAVFDAGVTAVMQDVRQDTRRLDQLGIRPNSFLDTQLCWILLSQATAAQAGAGGDSGGGSVIDSYDGEESVAGLDGLQRRPLQYLLSKWGFQHPNKSRISSVSQHTRALWLNAPRPLSDSLVLYAAADVRYLVALVLLMERDLMKLQPGGFMREMQRLLPRYMLREGAWWQVDDITSPLRDVVIPQVEAQILQAMTLRSNANRGTLLPDGGPPYMQDAPRLFAAAAAERSGGSSSSSSSSSTNSWLEPAAHDTRASDLVFRVRFPPPPAGVLQRLRWQHWPAGYELLVPAGVLHQAEAAAIAGAGSAGQAAAAAEAASAQAVECSSSSGGGSTRGRSKQQPEPEGGEAAVSPAALSWAVDGASTSLLQLLPTWLAGQVTEALQRDLQQLQQHQQSHAQSGTAHAWPLQLQEVLVQQDGSVQCWLGSDSFLAAPAGQPASDALRHAVSMQARPPAARDAAGGAASSTRTPAAAGGFNSSSGVLQDCLASLASWEALAAEQQEGADGGEVPAALLDLAHPIRPAGTAHTVTAVVAYGRRRLGSTRGGVAGTAASDSGSSSGSSSVAGLQYTAGRPQPGISWVLGDVLGEMAAAALLLPAMEQQPQDAPSLEEAVSGSSSAGGDSSNSSSDQGGGRDKGRSRARGRAAHSPHHVEAGSFSQHQQEQQGSSSLSGWSLGLPSLVDAGHAAGSIGQAPAGRLLLLLAGQGSRASSLLWDAGEQLARGWGCRVAAVSCASAVPSGALQPVLQLVTASGMPGAQADAVTAAWQLHGAQVVVLEGLTLNPEPVQAVQEALASGCNVIASADCAASLAELYQLATPGASSSSSRRGDAGSSSQQQHAAAGPTAAAEQQRVQGARQLWQLLQQLARTPSGAGGSSVCTVAECMRGYRWSIHCDLWQSLMLLQHHQRAPPAAAAAAGAEADVTWPASAPVVPVEVRQLHAAAGPGSPLAAAAALVDASGRLMVWDTEQDGSEVQLQEARHQRRHPHRTSTSSSSSSSSSSTTSSSSKGRNHDDDHQLAPEAHEAPGSITRNSSTAGSSTPELSAASAVELLGGVVVVARFSDYGAADLKLPPGLRHVVRRLLCPESATAP